jgi:BirA family biotin operon repressor/biotin-[acetyl-CoA-carboxylase] ligase
MTLSVLTFDSLDSTNEEARRWLQSHTGNVVIRARHQTAGKGTQGRRWVSPEGAGLYFSIAQAFSEDQVVPITPLLTIAAGVACVKALKSLTQLEIQLKPINDLYLEGCKLGGILVESLVNGGRCSGLITGIGINILRREEIIASCEQESRGNQPISLQDCIPNRFAKN